MIEAPKAWVEVEAVECLVPYPLILLNRRNKTSAAKPAQNQRRNHRKTFWKELMRWSQRIVHQHTGAISIFLTYGARNKLQKMQ